MFESAELGHQVDKKDYEREVPKLREALLEAQMRVLEKAEFPLILLSGGVDGGGKGEVVNLLLEWMDPRHIQVHAMGEPTDEELSRPPMWRFWRALPPKGKTGVFFGSWYTAPIVDRVYGRIHGSELTRSLASISRFERMLVDEGALVVKFWMHLSKKAQKQRFKELEKSPGTAWRVSEQDWERHRRYDRFREVSEHALRETSTSEAPWNVVEAADRRYRNLTVGRLLLQMLQSRLTTRHKTQVRGAPPPPPPIDARDVIEELDLSRSLSDAQYDKRLPKAQGALNAHSRRKRFREKHACIVVFEGPDAAGKGGAIRRVTAALDARRYDVVPIAAPTEEERAQPYLWRFWRAAPRRGHFTLFDRSWYGRVLVERVEGFAAEADWMRAYREIVDFEDSLVSAGVVVVKFWLQIDKKEQLRRFREREKTGYKRFKITRDDWRNREKWMAYERAVCDMVDRTSTSPAPWHLIEANDKKWARVRIVQTIADSIEAALRR
ncbi:MAG TPA: polyphosphate:AMP phosphotransferase [Polyangiaceae bacterium]|nr:polyphosphate:AMP phosphotransferase [Polyangiaceae bacterium]